MKPIDIIILLLLVACALMAATGAFILGQWVERNGGIHAVMERLK